ncbi:NUDIX hydrolase [Ruegeria sediminis]|uniref:NUDIX hydrolase n=1 Tax=Ruegeria sediminis TaxID=2583820 RepID=A0ABY2X318_9RHOB|nr:NUDIX hydrolase [Ruegeria sediminis]TMV09761.1 NUDIX hydrolase [Ruegeria sediminis]
MNDAIRTAWEEVVRPLILRPKRVQVAALCLRQAAEENEVLLITSRGRGRWIVPKGWPIDGLDGPESALREAWEEAGVRKGDVSRQPVGQYSYEKFFNDGSAQTIVTNVYRVQVTKLEKKYPEAKQRKRRWVSAGEAANLVSEPELKEILRGF